MDVNLINQEIRNNPSIKKTSLIADFTDYAFSFNKAVFDSNNSIVDFIVLEVNSLFEKCINLKKEKIIGRKITGFIQETDDVKEELGLFFSELTSSGISQTQIFLKSLQKQFTIFAFSECNELFSFFIKVITYPDFEISPGNNKMSNLADSKIKSDFFFETSTDAIVISQCSDGLFLKVNKGFTKITGYNVDEVTGRKSEEINIWADKSSRKQILNLLYKDNYIYNVEASFLKKNGEIINGLLSADLIDYNGSKCILSMTKDITDFKKALETKNKELGLVRLKAQESDRLKKSFLTNVSHEIRTPLNAIIGFVQLLKNNAVPFEKQKEKLEIIQKSGYYLLSIMNNIIDMSKIESGVIDITKSKVSLNVFLYEIFNSFKYKKGENRDICFSLNTKYLNQSDDIVLIDILNIKKVLNQLIGNAIKFTISGNIELGCKKSGRNTLLFFVKDTGIGIPEEHKEIIYERFRQTDESSTRQFGGLGLGLPIAKAIVNKLGGDIWFTSKMGNGTTFYFTVPYNKDDKK